MNVHLCHCRGAARRWSSGDAAWTDSHSGCPAPGEDMAEAVNHKHKKKLKMFARNDVESFSREPHLVCKITQRRNKTQPRFCLFVGWTLCGVCFVFSFCNNVIVMLI